MAPGTENLKSMHDQELEHNEASGSEKAQYL